MKNRLIRPTAALFPLTCGIGAYLGKGSLMAYYFALQLLSLCAVDCFRNAATWEPGVRRVDRRFGGAFLPCAFAAAILALLVKFGFWFEDGQPAFISLCAAALLMIEQLFEERMFALGRRIDGVLLSCVANGILLASFLLDVADTGMMYVLLGAALGAAIAVGTSYAIEPAHGFSLVPRNLGFAPLACVQTLLYPLIIVGTEMILHPFFCSTSAWVSIGVAPFYGWMLWRLARTPHRRTADEGRGTNLLLIAMAMGPAAAAGWINLLEPVGIAAVLGLVCSAAVFCPITPRFGVGVFLAVVVVLPLPSPWLKVLVAATAVAINVKGAFLKKR